MRAAHLAMTVKNMERTLDFYCNVLEAKSLWRGKAPQRGPQTDTIFELHDAEVTVSGVELHGIVVEFFEFDRPKIEESSFQTTYATGGWKHLAFEVEDIESKVAELKEKGVTFRQPIQTLGNGTRMVYFNDPDGIMLELNQPSPQDPANVARHE